MAEKVVTTSYVTPIEPAYMLLEMPRWHKPSNSYHRIQYLFVNRSDVIARYEEDLGKMVGRPFRILGLWEESVGSLRSMANDKRYDDFWDKFVEEETEASTLIQRAVRQAEVNEQLVANRSVFGPGQTTQRNGFPMEARDKVERRKGKRY